MTPFTCPSIYKKKAHGTVGALTHFFRFTAKIKSSVWCYDGCYLGEHPFIVAQNEGHFYPHLYFFVIAPEIHYHLSCTNIKIEWPPRVNVKSTFGKFLIGRSVHPTHISVHLYHVTIKKKKVVYKLNC